MYKSLFENATEAMVYISKYGDIININKKAEKISGYKKEDVVGKNFLQLGVFGLKDAPSLLKFFNKALKGEMIEDFEIKVNHKKGKKLKLRINASPIKIGDKLHGMIVTVKDFTARKEIEQKLRKDRNMARKFFDVAGTMLLMINSKGKVTMINKKGCELLGYKQKEIIGKNWFNNFIPKRLAKNVKEVFDKLMKGESKPVEFYENPIINKKGEERLILWRNTIIKNKKGKIIGALSSGEDVTERKRAEQSLRESKKKFEQLYDNAPTPYHTLTKDGKIININKKWCEVLGYKKEEVIGKSIFDFVVKEERDQAKASFKRKKKSKKHFSTSHGRRYLTKKGEIKIFLINDYFLFDQNNKVTGVQTTMQDITDLQESEERLSTIIEEASDPIIMMDAKGRIALWNSAAIKVFGYNPEEVIGKTPSFLLSNYDEKQFKKAMSTFLKSKGEIGLEKQLEIKGLKKDRSEFPMEVSISPTKINGKDFAILIIRDVTQHNEIRRMRAELQRKEELERVKNAIMMMIVHELKQPITPITGFVNLVKKELNDPKLIGYLDNVINCTNNMYDYIKRIIRLKSLEAGDLKFKFKKINLPNILNKAVENKSESIKLKKLRVDKNLKNVYVKADEGQLIEVFNNLIDNAVKFSKKGKRIVIKSWSEKGIAYASVKDFGVGINQDFIPRIFEKFSQTDEGRRIGGFGIGLSISNEIIKAHKGKILVNTEPGKGSEFVVSLKKAK